VSWNELPTRKIKQGLRETEAENFATDEELEQALKRWARPPL